MNGHHIILRWEVGEGLVIDEQLQGGSTVVLAGWGVDDDPTIVKFKWNWACEMECVLKFCDFSES